MVLNTIIPACTTLQQHTLHGIIYILLYTVSTGNTNGMEYSLSFLKAVPPYSCLCLYVTTHETWPVPFNITATGTNYSTNGVVRYGEVVTFALEDYDFILTKSYDEGKVITVRTESDGKLIVYAASIRLYLSDSYLALPKQQDVQESYKYIAVSYVSVLGYQSSLAIIAQYNDTQLSMIPALNSLIGATTRIFLQEGETYLIQSADDLTGMMIVSNRPIAMLSGHECTNVPTSVSACDHLVEQIPPVSSWGQLFATAPLKGRQAYDIFRILASENSTVVEVNCSLSNDEPALYNATGTYLISERNFIEFRVSSGQYCLIEGSENILVLQYATGYSTDFITGDPTMIIVPALSQYDSVYSLPTIQPKDSSVHFTHYMNIFIPAQYFQLDRIFLNKRQLNSYNLNFTTIARGGLPQVYAAQVDLTEGVHTLHHVDNEATLGVIMYGFSIWASYGHPGGLNIDPGTYYWDCNRNSFNCKSMALV